MQGHRGVQGLAVGGRRFRVQGDKARSAGPRALGAQTRQARCGPPRGLPASFLFVCVRVSVCSRLSYRRTLVLTTRVCMPVSCVGGTCRVSEGLWVGCVHTTCVRDPSPGLSHDEVCPLLNGRHCAETGSRVP